MIGPEAALVPALSSCSRDFDPAIIPCLLCCAPCSETLDIGKTLCWLLATSCPVYAYMLLPATCLSWFGAVAKPAWSLQMIATDNLDLGCTIFEKAATEKAIREIDERLIQQYTNRAKANGSNQPFYDQSQLHGRFPMHLPDSLKPKPGHLNPAQQRVYEDFARIPRGAAGAHAAVGGGKPMASMEKVLFRFNN